MLLKLRKNKKGFTLIELIVVVAILAILAAVAIPTVIGLQTKANNAVEKANAATVASAINVFNAQTTGTVLAGPYTTLNGAGGLNAALGASFAVNISGATSIQDKAVTDVDIAANGVATVKATVIALN